MSLLGPNLSSALDRELSDLAQQLSPNERAELMGALDHITRATSETTKPVRRLTDPRVPKMARAAICAITPFGFDGSWLAPHQRPWAATDKYEAVVKAGTATALFAASSPALDELPRYRTELLHNVLWLMTAAPSGKYATRYRTRGAVDDPDASLRHEHVFTRKSVAEALLKATADDIEAILRDRAVACTVTAAEHDRLKPFDETHQGWERYREAGVVVLDMLTGGQVDLS